MRKLLLSLMLFSCLSGFSQESIEVMVLMKDQYNRAELSRKADQVWELGNKGQGIVVAVVDTGVNYNHVDIENHLWDGGEEFPNHGFDIYNNDNDPMDDNGHGTHCAGIVCGDGTAWLATGVAPEATVMCIKSAGEEGSAGAVNIVKGMEWAVEHGCDINRLSPGIYIIQHLEGNRVKTQKVLIR